MSPELKATSEAALCDNHADFKVVLGDGFDINAEFLPPRLHIQQLDIELVSAAVMVDRRPPETHLYKALLLINRQPKLINEFECRQVVAASRVTALGVICSFIAIKRVDAAADFEEVRVMAECVPTVILRPCLDLLKNIGIARKKYLNSDDITNASLLDKAEKTIVELVMAPACKHVVECCDRLQAICNMLVPKDWVAWITTRNRNQILTHMVNEIFTQEMAPKLAFLSMLKEILSEVMKSPIHSAKVWPASVKVAMLASEGKTKTLQSYSSVVMGCVYILRRWPNASKQARSAQLVASLGRTNIPFVRFLIQLCRTIANVCSGDLLLVITFNGLVSFCVDG